MGKKNQLNTYIHISFKISLLYNQCVRELFLSFSHIF